MGTSAGSFDVIVIGLGVVGSAAAYQLARSGVGVVGLEQFHPNHTFGSSHGESRIIRYAYDTPLYIQWVREAYLAWAAMEQDSERRLLHITGGYDFGNESIPTYAATRAAMSAEGVPFEVLTAEEVARRVPQFRPPPTMETLYQAETGVLIASECVHALAKMAARHGAALHYDTQVTRILPGADHVRVETTGGAFEAGSVIMAAGAWMSGLLRGLDLALPFQPTREQVVYFDTRAGYRLGELPVFIGHDGFFYGLPDVRGSGMKVGVHCNHEDTDPDAVKRSGDPAYAERVAAFVRAYLPAVDTSVKEMRVCLYTMTPDSHFLLDRHPAYPNVILASPCSGHGFKFGILSGKVAAQLARGETPTLPIDALSVRRFTL